MSDLLSQLWTPEMQMMMTVVVVLLVILYVLSIIWVVRDAYLRGMTWWVWGIVALVPILGLIAYCMLRPPMLKIDRDEQNLEVELKKRQLMHYGECATCGYPVEADYVLCPNCHTQLKNLCARCKKALEPMWTVCPYCATPVSGASSRQRKGGGQRSRASQGQAAPRGQRQSTATGRTGAQDRGTGSTRGSQGRSSAASRSTGSKPSAEGGATTAMARPASRSTEEAKEA